MPEDHQPPLTTITAGVEIQISTFDSNGMEVGEEREIVDSGTGIHWAVTKTDDDGGFTATFSSQD